jgi:hypothetical protein
VKPDKALKAIKETREQIANAVRNARKDIAAIEARDEARLIARHRAGEIDKETFSKLRRQSLTPMAVRESIAERRKELGEDIAEIRETADDALTAIRDAEPAAERPDPAEAQRIWSRQLRRLEAGEDPIALAQSLQAAGDGEGFQILQEELPDHLRVVDADPRTARQTLQAVGRLETDVLTGDRAEHRTVLSQAEKAASLMSTNASLVESDLEATTQIFGETPEMTIDLTKENV